MRTGADNTIAINSHHQAFCHALVTHTLRFCEGRKCELLW